MAKSHGADAVESGSGQNEEPLETIVNRAVESADDGDVSLKNILSAWGDRSYGPLFILLGFIGGTPLAAIPGAAAIVGVLISLLAIQMIFGSAHPWLPDIALKRSISEDKLRDMRSRLEPLLSFLDNLITERLTWAAGGVMRRLAAFFVFCLGLIMVPFDAVPFAVAAPAWAIVLFGVAITARDGLVMIIALAAFSGIALLGMRMM
ncbi:exopolysaccharide biosynthesis protein [Hyphococcus sp.]|uniref:exopolysaccharide biosynthesis protein n=1 Tax=Hyphococcus sp. TaxID=2038636 RepID=UPI003CCB8356